MPDRSRLDQWLDAFVMFIADGGAFVLVGAAFLIGCAIWGFPP